MDPLDASHVTADLEEVDFDLEPMGCIERDLAVGLETEAGGPGRDYDRESSC